MDDGPPDVVKLNKLEAALIELAKADRDEDMDRLNAAISDVAMEWIKRDPREQACWLKYHPKGTRMGAKLRTALHFANLRYDLGVVQSNYDELKGRPWP